MDWPSRIIKVDFDLLRLLPKIWPEIIFLALSRGETVVAVLIGFRPRTLALRNTLEAAVDGRLGAGPNALASTPRPDQVTGTHWKPNGQKKSSIKDACKVWVVNNTHKMSEKSTATLSVYFIKRS